MGACFSQGHLSKNERNSLTGVWTRFFAAAAQHFNHGTSLIITAWIYIYIYIYICILSSTGSFILSQLFRVARHIGRFKLGSKPAQLYVRHSILPLSPPTTYVSSEIITHYNWFSFVYILCYWIPECSIRWKRFASRGWEPFLQKNVRYLG